MTVVRVVLILTILFVSATAQAAPVILNSNSTANDPSQTNDQTHDNVLITPNNLWHANGVDEFDMPYYWISFTNTGEGDGQTLPNVTLPITLPNAAPPTATFYDAFDLTRPAFEGMIHVWADDTARVYMDDILLIDANPVQGSACSNAPVSCTAANGFHYDLTPLHLDEGHHVLRIEAYQRAGDTFGVQYFGHVSQVPEPAGLLLVGAGLLSLGALRRKRSQA